MTDDERARIRSGIEALIRLVNADLPSLLTDARTSDPWDVSVSAFVDNEDRVALPELTANQQFALSVLVGEPDTVIGNALADYLIDQGHDYTTAAVERGRQEERERISELLHGEAAACLSRPENDLDNYAAAALQTMADKLLLPESE